MRLRYIYSACTIIQNEDLTIVSDPWFTPGIYDGSWFQYPPINDPVSVIGLADMIYISHIHPDHYDPVFLRKYLATYPKTKLIIGETSPNYLFNKMRLDGFKPEVTKHISIGNTEVFILPNSGYEVDNIDTAMVVRQGKQTIVNMNDNPFDAEQISNIVSLLPEKKATLALLPYAGAGPYPQTYLMSENMLEEKATRKREQFLGLFRRYMEALNPRCALPFAGKYWLGGPLSRFNRHRGLADATEAAALFPNQVTVLADGGKAFIDLATLQASATRNLPYTDGEVNKYLTSLDFKGYDYEREIQPLSEHSLPLFPLLTAAYRNAHAKTALSEDYWLCIKCHQTAEYFVLNLVREENIQRLEDCTQLQPRWEIFIDGRYLFGLLTRLYHWDNAEVGSQFTSLRVPDVYSPQASQFLNRLKV